MKRISMFVCAFIAVTQVSIVYSQVDYKLNLETEKHEYSVGEIASFSIDVKTKRKNLKGIKIEATFPDIETEIELIKTGKKSFIYNTEPLATLGEKTFSVFLYKKKVLKKIKTFSKMKKVLSKKIQNLQKKLEGNLKPKRRRIIQKKIKIYNHLLDKIAQKIKKHLEPLAKGIITINVADHEPPVFGAMEDVVLESFGPETIISLPVPIVHDNFDPEPTVTSDAPSTFRIGVTTVTYWATDQSGNTAIAYRHVTVKKKIDPTLPVFVLGDKDNSDAEFLQSSYELDYYPDIHPINQFSKEINTLWYPAQYIHFDLNEFESKRGLTFILDPAWNNGAGLLQVAIDVWGGTEFIEVGSAFINMENTGQIDIQSQYLKTGINDIRIRAVSGTGDTTIVTWDQIICQTIPFYTILRLGNNDERDLEYAQNDFNSVFNASVQNVRQFPKEINLYSYTAQYIHIGLNQAQADSGMSLYLDPAWNNGSGALDLLLEVWTGSNWVQAGNRLSVNSKMPGTIHIPSCFLKVGLNEMRLSAISGSEETTVVTWDQIIIDMMRQEEVFNLGMNEGSDFEFAQEDYNTVFNSDTQITGEFPKELNLVSIPSLEIIYGLTGEQSRSVATLSLDVASNNGNGVLTVAIERWHNSDWETIETLSLSETSSGKLDLSPDHLNEGLNRIRLTAVSGTNGTDALTWDRIKMHRKLGADHDILNKLEGYRNVALNYFLDEQTIHNSGLPLAALKGGDRSRFGYSKPAEWGYALQGWVIAAETRKISKQEAINRIDMLVNTLELLQNDSDLSSEGLFYSLYKLTDSDGNDLSFPKTMNRIVSSADAASLWCSLNTVQGWLLKESRESLAGKINQIKSNFNMRIFIRDVKNQFQVSMFVEDGEQDKNWWDVYSEQAGQIAFALLASGNMSLDEYERALGSLYRSGGEWNGIKVQEIGHSNTMFAQLQRTLTGFPMFGSFLGNKDFDKYGSDSFLPSMRAHLEYGKYIGVDYPGFSSSMVQKDKGQPLSDIFIPPNVSGQQTETFEHISPYGLFVPFSALHRMDSGMANSWFKTVENLKNDENSYWHESDGFPYGFEAVASPYRNVSVYGGADDGRGTYEMLAQMYMTASLFEGLQKSNGQETFYDFAFNVPGYKEVCLKALELLYGRFTPAVPRIKPIEDDNAAIYEIEWSISQGAAVYEIFESTNSMFVDPVNTYWVTGSSKTFEKTESGSWFYKIRAWTERPENGGVSSGVSNRVSHETDMDPPVFEPLGNITLEAAGSETIVTLPTPIVYDVFDPSPNIENNAPETFLLGTTTVTFTATDKGGNSSTSTILVTVVDTTPPIIRAGSDLIVRKIGDLTFVTLPEPIVIDLVDPFPSVVNNAPINGFSEGVTDVFFTATDFSGNSSKAKIQVNVNPDLYKFILGENDGSDAEFLQNEYLIDYYPDNQSVDQFSKEINLSLYPEQYIHFSLNESEANQELIFVFDSAWNDGAGALRIAMDVWTGNGFKEVGNTLVNMRDAGYINIPPGFLKVGMNDIRLRAVSGTGDTTVVTWDQIMSQTTSPSSIVWRLGNNDNSDAEFAQFDFKPVFNVNSDAINQFPKEINISSHKNQYIHFNLSGEQSQKAAVISFDAVWSDGSGVFNLNLERWNGSSWIEIGNVSVSQSNPDTLIVPAYYLKEGVNEWRLSAVSGTDGTTVVVWDSLSFYQRENLQVPVKRIAEDILDTTLFYFLSPNAIASSGLPLTALKISDRARFGYSNPTEWGYAIQAWIVAVERSLISPVQAKNKIDNALNTIRKLQEDPDQFTNGLFYPYYRVTDSSGKDLLFPYHDENHLLPSGDNALFYGSLNVAEGWLRLNGFMDVADKARTIKDDMNFRSCYFEVSPTKAYISHLIDADTGELSESLWLFYADEGGMVAFIAYQSGSITFDEYKKITNSQVRVASSWNGHYVREAAFFNSMFTWPQRSMVGFPMFGDLKERIFGVQSFLPNVEAHLDYGDFLGIDFPGFSDAMTQSSEGRALVGHFIPPNIEGIVVSTAPLHVSPYALAVPFCALESLDEKTLGRVFEKLTLLRSDSSGIWHPAQSQDPFGFEVVSSPYMNQSSYLGADDGRYIFELLSQSYVAFSLFEGLQQYKDQRNFHYFAAQVPEYNERVSEVLNYLYPND